MKIEIRAQEVNISGYVNATGKPSNPVITPHGKVIEVIRPHAFEKALDRNGDISLTLDHDSTHIYANTKDGSLLLYEDPIGLHADVTITDPDLISLAKQGKIKGWSFGMYNVKDSMEERREGLPVRTITDMDIDHITLVVNKCPVYSAMSVEVRAGEEKEIETRRLNIKPQLAFRYDNSAYIQRLNKIKREVNK